MSSRLPAAPRRPFVSTTTARMQMYLRIAPGFT